MGIVVDPGAVVAPGQGAVVSADGLLVAVPLPQWASVLLVVDLSTVVAADGLPPRSARLMRRGPDGVPVPVRFTDPAALVGGVVAVVDVEAPLGAPVTWWVEHTAGVSNPVVLTLARAARGAWLKAVESPSLSGRFDVVDFAESGRDTGAETFRIAGTGAVVVVRPADLGGLAGTLTLLTQDAAQRAALPSLAGGPFLSQGAVSHTTGDTYFEVVGEVTSTRVGPPQLEVRRWPLSVVEVGRPEPGTGPVSQPGWSCADVERIYASCAELEAAWGSCLALETRGVDKEVTVVENLVTNPSAEVDLFAANSGTGGLTLTRQVDATSYVGVAVYNCAITASGVQLAYLNDGSRIAVVAGASYAIQGRVRRTAGDARPMKMHIVWWTEAGAVVSESITATVSTATTSQWYQASGVFTAPATATRASVQLRCDAAVLNDVYQWDALMLEKATGVGPYFDGDTPDDAVAVVHAWSGAPHKSTSTRTETTWVT